MVRFWDVCGSGGVLTIFYYNPEDVRLDVYDPRDPYTPLLVWDNKQCVVRYQETEQNTYESIKYEWTKFMKTNQCYITDAVMVPKGYDGCVLGLYDRTLEWRDGMYFYDVADDNSLLFRFGNDNIGELSTNIPYIEVDLSKVETLDSYYDPSDYRLCYLVYVGLDSVVDYENSTFRGPLDIEEYEGIILRNWQLSGRNNSPS